MTPTHIIEKKQAGKALSNKEIEYFIRGYVEGSIPDYQMSAWLMAVYFQGMNVDETVNLTRAMLESGDKVDFSGVPGKRVDKHSTGGVGDKLSLLAAPTAAACGGQIPMISGRGLGHTGGTLDKLESIPGFSVQMTCSQLRDAVLRIGAALAGQNSRLVPADMKIYALRDVTATVKSIPLITASIISKKAAEGIDALVLDVKSGGGAVFRRREKMEELARMLVEVGNDFGIETTALLTNMDQPLGYAVGNWLEVRECVDIMRSGEGAEDLLELNRALAGTMLKMSGITQSIAEGVRRAEQTLVNGDAYAKFREIVVNQGGDPEVIDHPENYPKAKFSQAITANDNGFIHSIKTREAGIISMMLGAGRMKKEDAIDYKAGIVLRRKKGDAVGKGELLAEIYSDSEDELLEAAKRFPEVFTISEAPTQPSPLIYKAIHRLGEESWEAFSRT
ncbi:MAG: thymidine phosphorylase [candidate division Zixibacteria bacterium]|nr:thymidine phosphorylase [Candidatus Tariuqbacter arcticus]